jgi:hypothetical protein
MEHYKTGMQLHEGTPIFDGDFYLIGRDFQTGASVWGRDELNGGITIRHDIPIEETFKQNAEFEKATHGVRFGDWNRIASVPLELTTSLGLDKAIEQKDNKFLSKVFNDPDNRKFRTSRGRV